MVKKLVLIPVFLTLLFWGVPSAFALLVGISATWNSSNDNLYDPDTNPYGLREGSIVQVVAVQSGQNPPTGTDPSAHFVQYGTTTDTAIQDSNVYLANTTFVSGNDIVYTGQLTSDGNGGLKFQTYVYLENINSYDTIYLRVFSATNFQQGVVAASGWGIGSPQQFNPEPGILPVLSWDNNISITSTNYFEVIPEPGTLGLLWSGLFGIGTAGFWRRARRKRSAGADGTGDKVP